MEDIIKYIDDYFNGLLGPEEKRLFEERCEQDVSFATEVAAYITSRQSIRDELLVQKKAGWKELAPAPGNSSSQNGAKLFSMKRWLSIAAAACMIGVIVWLIPFGKNQPGQLASDYIKENFQTLPVEMGGSEDSLQMGLSYYNKKQYDSAQSVFSSVYSRDSLMTEALKFSGLTYLMQQKYSEAIGQFNILASRKNLFSNPGLFYEALTLLKRNTRNDKETAKKLLQEVVDKNLEGSAKAAGWLKYWN